MSKDYDNTNSGVLFENDKGNNPKRPDYRGTGNWQGQEFNISAWIKESKKDGSKFFSFRFEDKQPAKPKGNPTPSQEFQDDDIPF
jgi:uncharacterized protein (DUF736 family)